MTTLADYTTLKLGDIKQLISNCVQLALENEESEFFKACEELRRLRGALDPKELREEHLKWHRRDNWRLVGKEVIDNPYVTKQDAESIRLPHQLKLEFDAGLYRAWVTVAAYPPPEGDIRQIDVLIGAFWAPEHQPPTGPVRVRG